MASNAKLIVDIITDASKAGKGIDEASGKFGKFNTVMGNLVGPASAALGGISVLAAGAVSAASDLQQAAGGTEAVFGDSAGQIEKWAASAASSVGLSSASYQTFAAQIGAQLKNLGVPMDQVAGQTNDLITLGADLAATYGGTTEEAVSALSAAFRGEADPAERYGLALNTTKINAELAARGLSGLEGEQANAARAAVIMDTAMSQAGDAVGQYGRESDTLAGQQQELSAKIEDMAAAFGTALLPVITPVVAALADFAEWMGQNTTLVSVIIGVIAALAAIVLVYAAAQWVANAAMLANPVGLVIAGIVLLIAAITALVIWIATNTEEIRGFFVSLWENFMSIVRQVGDWFTRTWRAIMDAFRNGWNQIAGFFRGIWAGIRSVIGSVASFFSSVWNGAISFVRGVFRGFGSAVNSVVSGIRNVVGSVANWFRDAWQSAVSAVSGIIRTLQGVFSGVFGAIRGAIDGIVGAFNAVIGAIRSVIDWLSRIRIPDVLGSIGNLLGANAAVMVAGGTNPAVFAARGVSSAVPSVAAIGARSASGGTVINVSGGLDSADTIARRVRAILDARDRRESGVRIVRSPR